MSLINDRLKQLNIVLPPAPAPAANYVPYVKSNKLIFVSGQIPDTKISLLLFTYGT